MNDELQYQGMNIKTLAMLIDVPYTTITNARNRPNNVPPADIALRISKVLNKSIDWLVGDSFSVEKDDCPQNEAEKLSYSFDMYQKYHKLIAALETLPLRTQEAFTDMAVSLMPE